MFDSQKHTFTYHPETTPKYYLSKELLENYLKQLNNECDIHRDIDTLEFIKTMEEAHSNFCLGIIDSKERRAIIERKQEWYIQKHLDKPQHANAIYDKFYKIVNMGRW